MKRRDFFILILLAVFVFFFRLGSGTLYWDEAIYAQISKEMIESGTWITPHWNVVFIVGEYEKGGIIDTRVVGTGSLIYVPSSVQGKGYIYVATAAHVVRPLIRSWVQVNR